MEESRRETSIYRPVFFQPATTMKATNTSGMICVIGTAPGDAVRLGFGVKPVCAIVIPVDEFAMKPINAAPIAKKITMSKRVPTSRVGRRKPGIPNGVEFTEKPWFNALICA